MNKETLTAFERLSEILDTLRCECPWDRVQTLDSLRYLTIEEVYELSEAILTRDQDNPTGPNDDLKKELGDLFMHLMFYAKIAEDEGRFTLADVLNGICDKLIGRHPFIYNKDEYHGESWEQLKMHEGRRSVREGAVGPIGMWISTFAFIPIGLLFTYQATTDVNVFDLARWRKLLGKVFRKK